MGQNISKSKADFASGSKRSKWRGKSRRKGQDSHTLENEREPLIDSASDSEGIKEIEQRESRGSEAHTVGQNERPKADSIRVFEHRNQQGKGETTEKFLNVWYRKSQEPEIHRLPTLRKRYYREVRNEADIATNVTHLAIKGDLPTFDVIGTYITHVGIWGLSDISQLDRLEKLDKLQVLHIYECDFSRGLPLAITELTSLKELELQHCKLTELPLELANLQQLQRLNLSLNWFAKGLPLVVTKLNSLERLDLWSCKLENLPSELVQLKHLQQLCLDFCKFSSGLPPVIAEMKSLKKLKLASCELKCLPAEFSNLQDLCDLNLCHNNLHKCPQPVYKLKKLESLDISYNNMLTGIEKEILHLPNICTILTDHCHSLTHPPLAVCEQGLSAMKKYFTDSETSETAENSFRSVNVDVHQSSTGLTENSNDQYDIVGTHFLLAPVTKPDIRNLFTSDEVYAMSAPVRGRCLIINNRQFEQPTTERSGADRDVQNIQHVFTQLSFDASSDLVYNDLSCQEMVKVITMETQHPAHQAYGMFVLVIMTHGNETHLSGSDGKTVELSKIYELMSSSQFPSMAGKPKWLIMQDCCGESMDLMTTNEDQLPSVQLPAKVTAQQSTSTDPLDSVYSSSGETSHLPAVDFIVMRARYYNYVSMEHVSKGSWFIRALVESLYTSSCHSDVQTLFEKQVMAKMRTKQKSYHRQHGGTVGQLPIMRCSFTGGKKLYLFPKMHLKT